MSELRKYAIWKDKTVIGYIELAPEQASELNRNKLIGLYFGYDSVTNPELYENNCDWIPISSGLLPPDGETVQITYSSYSDSVLRNKVFGYISYNNWYIGDYAVKEKGFTVIAWKPNGQPYKGD